MKEEWKRIKEFPDYSVSSFGSIKSHKRRTEGVVLSLIKKPNNYLCVNLMKDGKMYQRLVHRLVAIEFVECYKKGYVVNHKDFDKQNNHKDNLEWVTARENVSHYYSNSIDTSSKYLGVHKHLNSWRVLISIEGIRYHLGKFKNEKEAYKIYKKALYIYEMSGLENFLEYKKTLYVRASSKYKGVCYIKSRNKWGANFYYKGKTVLKKRFDTEEEAVKSVIETYREIGKPLHYSHEDFLRSN